MTTSIEARQGRPLNYESFAHLTRRDTPLGYVPLLEFTPEGLLFDGDLTDTEIGDVWWYATSADDADQARREALYARLGEAVDGTHSAGWQTDVLAELLRYQLGLT